MKYILKYIRAIAVVFIILFTMAIPLIIYDKKNNDSKLQLSPYPDGKNFAFTITADPDENTLEKDKIIYEFFTKVGLKTTIAVWVKDATRSTGIPDNPEPNSGGVSCEEPEYLNYIKELQRRGFEIALHTVTSGNDPRPQTIEGYELFKDYFGVYPSINIMHSTNLENVYWGKKVVDHSVAQWIIDNFVNRGNIPYSGEIKESEYFWGDILKKNTKYVRLWGTTDINTLKFNPSMPYHDPEKPYVNYWFSFSDGRDVEIFNELISDSNVRKLKKERGASIVYVHFYGFVRDGKLNSEFQQKIINLTKQEDGWFVPASTLLDRLLAMKRVRITNTKNVVYVTNLNTYPLEGVTILLNENEVIHDQNGVATNANKEGEIVLDSLEPGGTKSFFRNFNMMDPDKEYPSIWERLSMVFQRSLIYVKHNY